MPRFIFFDLDETLLDDRHAVAAAARAFFKEHPGGCPGTADEFARRWTEATVRHIDRWHRGECSFIEQRRARLREVWPGTRLADSEADRIFGEYRRHYEANARPFPDTLPCLEALAGQPMGVITNGDPAQQRNKLRNAGLGDRFDPVVVSGDIDIEKPDSRIFLEAARQAGRAPAECIYVGDRLDTDALASARAGMTGVWLDRGGRGGAPEGILVIRGLSELLQVIERDSPGSS